MRQYLRSIEDLHSERVHSCDVPLVTVHLVRLGGLCGVLLLSWRDVRTHYVKSELGGEHGKTEVNVYLSTGTKTALITIYFN